MTKGSKKESKSEQKLSPRKRSEKKTSPKVSFERAINKNRSGNAAKGWGDVKPQRKSERITLQKQCGNEAFLLPKDLKFPIVPRQETVKYKEDKCLPDCRGIAAAKLRSAQHHYNDVKFKSDKLYKDLCAD
jgi:hypothetical protein